MYMVCIKESDMAIYERTGGINKKGNGILFEDQDRISGTLCVWRVRA
jgi:hypothetical protein